jgi:hypothetical protein
MGQGFEIRQDQLSLQAHFASPVFDLFKDVPGLVKHLYEALRSYGIRLADVKLDSAGESLGQVNLQISWPQLATASLFLDRIELASTYPPFLDHQDGALVADLFASVAAYSPELSYTAFAVTREVHGKLDLPLKDFLSRFSAATPKSLGPALGSGTVFYFGPADNRLTGSLILDFSRLVEEGMFVKVAVVYDASQVGAHELLATFRSQSLNLIEEIGLDLRRLK